MRNSSLSVLVNRSRRVDYPVPTFLVYNKLLLLLFIRAPAQPSWDRRTFALLPLHFSATNSSAAAAGRRRCRRLPHARKTNYVVNYFGALRRTEKPDYYFCCPRRVIVSFGRRETVSATTTTNNSANHNSEESADNDQVADDAVRRDAPVGGVLGKPRKNKPFSISN